MLTAVNSHVNLDLGIAAMLAAEGNLASLEDDFDRINMLLADEVSIFLDTAGQLSPRVTVLRRLVPCQDRALNLLLRVFRNLAWSFANQGLWWDVSGTFMALGVVAVACYVLRYVTVERSRKTAERLFGKYAPAQVVDQVLRDPSLAKLGGSQTVETTLWFCDINS